jgi:hypothetical protein
MYPYNADDACSSQLNVRLAYERLQLSYSHAEIDERIGTYQTSAKVFWHALVAHEEDELGDHERLCELKGA